MLRHFSRGLFKFIIWAVIASVALLYALGYHVNWDAHSIQQTGSISLRSANNITNVTVKVNGQVYANSLPVMINQLFPGQYLITVEKKGYTSWEKLITVDENKVISYPGIFLVYSSITPEPLSADELSAVSTYSPDTADIIIKGGNSLYINNGSELQYISRFSDDIVSGQWMNGRKLLLLQVGKSVILMEQIPDGYSYSSTLFTLPQKTKATLMVSSDGRRLVATQGEWRQAYTLY